MQQDNTRKIKVAILVGSISRNAGGLYNSVRRHVQELSNFSNVDLCVFSLKDEFSDIDISAWENVNIRLFRFYGPSYYGFSPSLYKAVKSFSPHIIHLQGVWMWMSWISFRLRKTSEIVITPRGMVDSWALKRKKLIKTILMFLYEKKVFNSASIWQALNVSEADSIKSLCPNAKTVVIGNGMDLPKHPSKMFSDRVQFSKRTLLFLGRIHPKKGLHELITAWSLLTTTEKQGWKLQIVGWGEPSHINYYAQIIKAKNTENDIELFPNGVYGKEKQQIINQASAFILPSFSEGLPMAILEAWINQIPVLMTLECNLTEAFKSDCRSAIQISTDPLSLSNTLRTFISTEYKSHFSMVDVAFQNTIQNFSWSNLAVQLLKVYQDISTETNNYKR